MQLDWGFSIRQQGEQAVWVAVRFAKKIGKTPLQTL